MVGITDDPGTTIEYCKEIVQAQVQTEAVEQATRQHTTIILGMFTANLLMIITGRIAYQQEPFKINMINKKLDTNIDIEKTYFARIDRALFGFNFMLISFLTVLQFIDYGYFIGG